MSREIKFRAWDIYKKKFIPENLWAILPLGDRAQAVMLCDWEEYKEGEYFYPQYQILSQYTGLKDKNGVEIYEGDIVAHNNHINYRTAQVEFFDGAFRIHRLFTLKEVLIGAEVIGNIYENAELLNG